MGIYPVVTLGVLKRAAVPFFISSRSHQTQMKQVLRKGFKDIVVDEVPDPVLTPHHVLVRPHYSLISSGTETASIHPDVLKEVAQNPSQLQKVLEVAKVEGPMKTAMELKAKFSAYAVLGYSGAGVVVSKHPTVKDLEIGERVA